jgi:pyruvate/2-oxoglutarate dehydrogenase complex dihydrolipoamide dehydrogenase (E3) component
MSWEFLTDWFMNLGAEYGVNPVIFGSISLGAIPFFWLSVAWLVRNMRRSKPIFLPVMATSLCVLSAYIYLFIAGENLPLWVYGLVVGLIGYSAYTTAKSVREKTATSDASAESTDSSKPIPASANGTGPGQGAGSDGHYDLVVIGGGAGGLTAAGVGTNVGAKTLMVERNQLGGDCTWHGCVPSKALLKSAKIAHNVRQARDYGIDATLDQVDFQRVMERVRDLRADIYEEDDHPRNFEDMGIDVRHGHARFIDDTTIEITGDDGSTARITGRYVVIAAGASAFVPPIDGIDDVPYLTNETLFELDEQPERMAVVGSGPIGTEMAQAFTRLGTQVTVFETMDRILRNDNEELARMLQETLIEEGVQYQCGARVSRVSLQDDGAIRVEATTEDGATKQAEADALLMATGRRPNLDGLGLDAAGIEYTKRGITVNDRCRTNKSHIYAVGDITGRYQFTHMSEHMAKTAVTNAIVKLPQTIDTANVPWVTFTDPELGHVGATEAELTEQGVDFETYRFPYTKVDRAVTDGTTTGLIKVFAKRWNGKILGASVLGVHAGELISEYAVAMKNGVTLRTLSDTIHPYPSYGLAARRAADQWYAQKQSTTFTKILQTVLGYDGPVLEPDPDRIV